MSFLLILMIAVGLAMDAFAVSVASSISLRRVSRRQVFRFAFHFGLFQAMMPTIGWALGSSVQGYVYTWDHWIAFLLLGFVGSKAIYEACGKEAEEGAPASDPTKGWSLVLFSVATSIDALAVGFSFAMLDTSIWLPVLVIGVVTAGLTTLGMLFGSRLGARFGKRVEILGGLVLIAIGLKILGQHLFYG